jgi:hypothetical protein
MSDKVKANKDFMHDWVKSANILDIRLEELILEQALVKDDFSDCTTKRT